MATIGLTQAQAKAKLAQYGLRARVINQETPSFRPGLCIYQRPVAGIEVKIGSAVSITIARVPTTTTTTHPRPPRSVSARSAVPGRGRLSTAASIGNTAPGRC